MASSAAASTANDATSLKDSFIPTFSGSPQDYREWRKRISLYHYKMKLSKRAGESVLNVVSSLTGAAWRLMEEFDPSTSEKEGVFEEILAKLDTHFEYDSRVQLPADFDAYFGLSRKTNQSLMEYVTLHDELLRKLGKHNIILPDAVQGWHLLRRANITKEQRQLITLRAPLLEKKKVVEALYLVLGQDHRAVAHQLDRRPYGKGKGHRGYVTYDENAPEELYGDPVDGPEDFDDSGSQAYYGWESEWDYNQEEYEVDGDGYDMNFDANAAYYQQEGDDAEAPWLDTEAYDEAYAAYLDARKRFSDLRLSRGYLPIVALSDPSAGNLSPGVQSPTSSPTSKGKSKSGKGKGGKGKGKGKNIYRYSKPPAKGADPKGRAQAVLSCLRCGQTGHQAANCPVPPRHAQGTKRAATESMALEEAHVTFQDCAGHERHDVAMLDPGASAFLCGFGPARRYIHHLKGIGFPTEQIIFHRCRHKFHFGGDGESWSHWVVQLPMMIQGRYGQVQVFLLPGETPMLCGRPIIEALGIAMDFENKALRYRGGTWFPATLGLHGEYLLPLWTSEQLDESFNPGSMDLDFDLRLAPEGEVEPTGVSLLDFIKEETAFVSLEVTSDASMEFGEHPLPKHQLQTFEQVILEEHNDLHGYVTSELHSPSTTRVIWEVYTSQGRLSSVAETLGAHVEVFGYATGWDFDLPDHRRQFLARLEAECPDELFLAPSCGPWSPMQNLAAREAEQQEALQELREWHHETHLKFVRKCYLTQVKQGGHAHIEQPAGALSWKTHALSTLPGLRCTFDQCEYGSMCQAEDGRWLLTKKPTSLQTTKMAVFQAFSRRCSGDHEHCPLEGHAAGYGRRTKYMESYQPTLATMLASALLQPEAPSICEFVGAVSEEKEQTGVLIKLLATNKQDVVRTVQRLHRNLGHPSAAALAELLQSRGASDEVIEVAKNYHCAACHRYKKPNSTAPATLKQATSFNQTVQADVMWIKLHDRKVPILHLVDSATKYQVASVVHGEQSKHFSLALERHWIRHFGVPAELVTDEGRGWLSDAMQEFLGEHGIVHTVSPGEAHTRLSAVERRHAVLRKAVEIYLDDRKLNTKDGIREALAFVLPQINASPTVSGYSPSQWVLGFQPHFPGDLFTEGLNPVQLNGSTSFEDTLTKRTAAKMALIQADQDQKLRRALLRRYSGENAPLRAGQLCFYWRDARSTDLMKIRWRGPARVILREDDDEGKPLTYWVAHGTQLLRCAPHHVRGDFRHGAAAETAIGGLEEARRSVASLKSRGVTRFMDLNRLNKRTLDDVDTDEEGMDDDDTPDGGPPLQRPRLDLPLPEPPLEPHEMAEVDEVSPVPTTPAHSPTGTVIPVPDDDPGLLAEPATLELDGGNLPITAEETPIPDEAEPNSEPSVPPSVRNRSRSPPPIPTLDPATAALYEPTTAREDFLSRRRRFDRQETLQFGPATSRTSRPSSGPYGNPLNRSTSNPVAEGPTETESYSQVFLVENVDSHQLPEGWTVSEDGYMVLTNDVTDFWEVRSGCLIRHHVVPRHSTIDVSKYKDIPIDPKYLDPIRVTVMRQPDGHIDVTKDDGSSVKSFAKSWTGASVFQNFWTCPQGALHVYQLERKEGWS